MPETAPKPRPRRSSGAPRGEPFDDELGAPTGRGGGRPVPLSVETALRIERAFGISLRTFRLLSDRNATTATTAARTAVPPGASAAPKETADDRG
jgi:hypothetical protein